MVGSAIGYRRLHLKAHTVVFLLKSMIFFAASVLLLPAITASAAVVSGSFVYAQESDGSLIQYRVDAVDYQGTPAWRIAWDCDKINAEHYVRRSDGAPLYVKRINHSLKRTVEIVYSLDAKKPNVYRKRTEDEYIERKIWDKNLRDLGVIPQLLMGFGRTASDSDKPVADLTFSAINYDDGKVYALIAKQTGFRTVTVEGDRVRCAIYEVKLNSWLASFVSKTRLLISHQAANSNFVSYSGPSLDGSDQDWSLRLVGKDKAVAMLEQSKLPE